nr:Wzz/FepE/Etk N-terminal domain-containing protein [Paenibacillus silvisoli]
MELQRYWRVVKKRLWMIALIVLVGCTLAGYYSNRVAKPQYEASAKLIVTQNADLNALKPSLDVGSISSNILLIKTYKEIIRTPRIMAKVVQQHPELQASANELVSKVNVSSVNESQVMSVSVRDGSYERAAKIANAVSDVFRQEIRTLMKVDNVSILNEADPSERRGQVSPNPSMNMMVAFVLALIAGIAAAFIADQMDDTVKTEEDIRTKLGIPLLAAIPDIKRGDLDNRGSGHHTLMKNAAGRKRNVSLDA